MYGPRSAHEDLLNTQKANETGHPVSFAFCVFNMETIPERGQTERLVKKSFYWCMQGSKQALCPRSGMVSMSKAPPVFFSLVRFPQN
jgi:hypothetical protein